MAPPRHATPLLDLPSKFLVIEMNDLPVGADLLAQDFDDEIFQLPLLDDQHPDNDSSGAVTFGEWMKIPDDADFTDFDTRMKIVKLLASRVSDCHDALAAKGGGLLFGSFKLVLRRVEADIPGTRTIAWNASGFSTPSIGVVT